MMGQNMSGNASQILIFQTDDNNIKVDVHLEDESVWLAQAQMAMLFDKSNKTISEHIGNIFKEGDLLENSVVRKFRITSSDGKPYETKHYNHKQISRESSLKEIETDIECLHVKGDK